MTRLPAGFVLGVATAAYQIEGAVREEGRQASIWDTFSHTPGRVLNGDTGDIACDHYHRWQADVALMRELGVHAYRFSIAWPRILPTGRGAVNEAGLDFYERLVDALLAAGIEPFATLYHWDLPQALQDEVGGWTGRETAQAFADYADVVSHRLGDRVKHWITLNEPYVSAFEGYEDGRHAPGLKEARLAWQVSHHLLLAHGLAVPILRANCAADTRIGITLNLMPAYPATSSPEDQRAAQLVDGKVNRWFLDPLFRGNYPPDLLALLEMGNLAPHIETGDSEIIARPLDFLGVNYYSRALAHQKSHGSVTDIELVKPHGAEVTEMGWEVFPQGLSALLVRLHQEYRIPQLFITENGAAFQDTLSPDGHVHDESRVSYLREHFQQALNALGEGVPLAGYFIWSLLDNFEWGYGYSKRFGLVYVDFATQRRVVKDSGQWYKAFIGENRGG